MPISALRRTTLPPLPSNNSKTDSLIKTKDNVSRNLTKVYKNVLLTVDNIEKDILKFSDLLMKRPRCSTSELLTFLSFLEEKLNVEEIKEPNHLFSILEKNSQRTKLLGSEYFELQGACEKLLKIQYMIQDVPVKLDYIFHRNLIPFCLSLIEEVGTKEIPPITKEYEDIIQTLKSKLKEVLEEIEKVSFQNESQIFIRDYIKNYEKLNKIILTWCELHLEVCSMAKSWVDIDRLYPEKLRDTIFWLRNRRKTFAHRIHHLRLNQIKVENDKMKLEEFIKKSESEKIKAKSDVTHYFKRERNAVVAKKKLEQSLIEEEEILHFHINERAICSDSRKAAFHTEQIQLYKDSLNQIQKRLHRLDSISNEFLEEQQKCSQSKDYNKKQLIKHKEEHDSMIKNIKINQQEMNDLVDKINSIEDQIIVVQRIRSMKLDDSAFKLMNTRNYQPGNPKSYNDQTDDFFKLAASVIGNLWKEVYKALIFDPPRDWKQIEMDLEMIDINNRRLEPDFVTLAYLSLQKWRRLSNQATIENLIKVLKKKNLAKYIRPLQRKSITCNDP